ncbi:MAG: AAA family ATPase [Deltaproteobacteria bacterium]|nr:AAA family ATPase [Deltaproteobacteria bacterium]
MRISRIKLVNWKNFKEADVEIKHRAFIVGPNASGKSNFLDAIRFLRDIVRQGGSLQEAVRIRDGVSKIRCVAARRNSDITIGIEVTNIEDKPEWHYELTFNQTGGGIAELRAVVKKEYLKNLITGIIYIDRPNGKKESGYLLEFTYIEQATVNEGFKNFIGFLNEISYLHLIPQLVRDPKSFLKTSKGEDYYGRDFMERILALNKHTRDAYLNRVERALRYALPNLEKLGFKSDEMGVPHFEATFKQWRGKGVKHQEKLFSDGTLRFIGLFWALQDGTKPILLEEPELSLHSAIITRLADVIYKLQKKKTGRRQVMVTTHSYEILNNVGISAEEILLITTEGEEGSNIISSALLPEVKTYMQAGNPIGDLVISRTSPKNIHQLTLFD